MKPLQPPSFEAVLIRDQLVREAVLGRFARSLRGKPPVTTGLILAAVAVHLLVGLTDHLYLGRDLSWVLFGGRTDISLFVWGARLQEAVPLYKGSQAVVLEPDAWRMFSCIFLHGGLMHLALNMLALFGLGRLCEAVFGPARMLWLFLLSGLAGSLLSHLGGTGSSVGASGAVFGLMGAGVVYGVRHRRSLPGPLRSVFGRGLMPWVVLNLVIGVSVPGIDNLGHVGGMLGGAACAAVLADRIVPGQEPAPPLTRSMWVIGGLILSWTALEMGRSVFSLLSGVLP